MNKEKIIRDKVLKEKVLLIPNPKSSKEFNNFIIGANDTIKGITIPITIYITLKEIRKEADTLISQLQEWCNQNRVYGGWINVLELDRKLKEIKDEINGKDKELIKRKNKIKTDILRRLS
jgi:hypothetical protein